MLQPGNSVHRIEVFHKVIEHSAVITHFFDILIDRSKVDFEKTRLLGHVIDLSNKWEAHDVLRNISDQLRIRIASGKNEDDAFGSYLQVAAKLDDLEMIALMIGKWGKKTWSGEDYDDGAGLPDKLYRSDPFSKFKDPDLFKDDEKRKAVKRGKLFEPGTMLFSDYCRIPPLVHWAIARAIHNVAGADKRVIDWKAVAREFGEITEVKSQSRS